MKKIFTLLSFSFVVCLFSFDSNAQTIPNSGFETWTNVNTANTWKSNNTSTVFFLRQSTDKHTGTYAAEVSTKAGSAGNLSGILTLGTINSTTQSVTGGLPISSKPTDLHGYYKYTAGNGAEQMEITVKMTKRVGSTLTTLATGVFSTVAGQSTSTYTLFTIPLTYNPTTIIPDTFNITVKSSKTTAVVGSIALIDDLAFTTATGVEESIFFEPKMWPNPANSNVNFNLNGEEYDINIVNMLGQTVASARTHNELFTIETGQLPIGFYSVNIESKTQRYTMRLLVSR
jgi:hypothetical protein